jgi:hypothetical protein
VCRSYGFYQRTCPLVYTIEGTLIGDGAAFVEHVRERYQKILAMTKDTQKKRTAENMHEIQEMMRKKKEPLTLGETIEKQIEKVKGKEAITHVGDTFFQKESEGGLIYFVRRSDMFAYAGRCLDVEDEEAKASARAQAAADAEAKRDARYEEFKSKYEDHIEGKAPNDRLDRVSNFGDDNKSSRSKSAKDGKRGKSSQSNRQPEEKEEVTSMSDVKSSKTGKSGLEHQDEINRRFDEERMALPESCFISFPKSSKIEKLEAKYLLVAHPYPQIEGEMLIVQPKKDDQPEKDLICYRDYSLRKRMHTREKPALSATEQLK